MATGAGLSEALIMTAKAVRDLSGCQYKGVEFEDDNTVDIPSAGAKPPAVLQDKPAAAQRACRVVVLGRTKAYLGQSSLTAGTTVSMAASGWFVKATSGYDRAGFVIKTANSGYIGEIFLTGPGFVSTSSVYAGQI